MKRAILTVCTVLLLASCGCAETKIGAIGTTQLAGEWAAFNKPYSLGNKGSKMNFTLKSAEYTMGQVIIGDSAIFPKEGEKLLVLHYTIHNPEKALQTASWSTFGFTAVDSEDANHEDMNEAGQETNLKKLHMDLKPAQKAEAYTVIRVGSNGEVPKLIVRRGNGMILRFDLRGRVKPLPAPYADPADSTGATALAEVAASIGQYVQGSEFDFRVDSVEVSTEAVGDLRLKRDGGFAIVRMTVKNKSTKEKSLVWSVLKPELSVDTGSAKWVGHVADGRNLERTSSMGIKPAKETAVAYIFETKANAKPESLQVKTRNGMLYNYDLTTSK